MLEKILKETVKIHLKMNNNSSTTNNINVIKYICRKDEIYGRKTNN